MRRLFERVGPQEWGLVQMLAEPAAIDRWGIANVSRGDVKEGESRGCGRALEELLVVELSLFVAGAIGAWMVARIGSAEDPSAA
jgi:hypothetical protein